MKRGTIVLAKFPFTDLKSAKRRPALIISNNPQQEDFIVLFISTRIPEIPFPTDFILDSNQTDFKESGLKTNSVFRADKIATLNKSIFTGEIGNLSEKTLLQIDQRLKISLGIK